MLHFVKTDLFKSDAQTLVNTVNIVGVMGKGIALKFKERYPSMYSEYRMLCDQRDLTIGSLHLWRGLDKWVLNFPTKTTWRKPSKLIYIEQGLQTFRHNYNRLGIRSVSFPPLGCGNGELDWQEVKPLITQYLDGLDIPVYVHEILPSRAEQPEHNAVEAGEPPATFGQFTADVRSILVDQDNKFKDWISAKPYRAVLREDGGINIYVDECLVVDEDFLATAWVALRLGVLSLEHLGSGAHAAGNFLFPILGKLPYIQIVEYETAGRHQGHFRALRFSQRIESFDHQYILAGR